MKYLIFFLYLFFSLSALHAECPKKPQFWQTQIDQASTLEAFFINNYECQPEFYSVLDKAQKLYFDTVVYPSHLTKTQYQNRWLTMAVGTDTEFFKRFSFFNNYFKTHKNSITEKQMECFQTQKGFKAYVSEGEFYQELAQRNMTNDVSYLYPLIRWAYVNNGIDMTLSRERVNKAEQLFGIKRGKVGDREQFARFLALYDGEYQSVAHELSERINITTMDAYKLLVIITYLESRGNIFAVSRTGAFGPMQSTLHFYMMYGEPNNPFDPKASLVKLANKFVHYHRQGDTLDASVVAYKSGSLDKCINGVGHNSADCKYYYDYKNYMSRMHGMHDKSEISRYMTGKSYFFPELARLKRVRNQKGLTHYEPYQYALLKGGVLSERAKNSLYLSGGVFKSLGKMKRSEIYKLQDIYGANKIGVVSDKKVCW